MAMGKGFGGSAYQAISFILLVCSFSALRADPPTLPAKFSVTVWYQPLDQPARHYLEVKGTVFTKNPPVQLSKASEDTKFIVQFDCPFEGENHTFHIGVDQEEVKLAYEKSQTKEVSVRRENGGNIKGMIDSVLIIHEQEESIVNLKVNVMDLSPRTDMSRVTPVMAIPYAPDEIGNKLNYSLPRLTKHQRFMIGSTINPWPAIPIIVLGYRNIGLKERRALIVKREDLINSNKKLINLYLVPKEVLRLPASGSEALRHSSNEDDESLRPYEAQYHQQVLSPWTYRHVWLEEEIKEDWQEKPSTGELFESRLVKIRDLLRDAEPTNSHCAKYLYDQKH